MDSCGSWAGSRRRDSDLECGSVELPLSLNAAESRAHDLGICHARKSGGSAATALQNLPQRHELQVLDLVREKLGRDPAESLLGIGHEKPA